ncbi:MAG: DUF3365 domain-containing protein, partial [Methylococcales bacterium]|nr:DUF3365 domain-containing protein [Methylococcales bacterium]
MKLQSKVLTLFGVVFLIIFTVFESVEYRLSKERVVEDAKRQAESIQNILMSVRRIYHQQFLNSGIALNEKTIGFLPAHAINRISKDFSDWDTSGLQFNNVSDRPRNPSQKADLLEMEIMSYFRSNPEATNHIQSYTHPDGQSYFLYSRPIWVEQYCLKCHGEKKQAPPTIQKLYNTAYDYKVGDLRGLLSIRLPADYINQRIQNQFLSQALVHLMIFIIMFVAIIILMKRYVSRPINNITSYLKAVADQKECQPPEQVSVDLAPIIDVSILIKSIQKNLKQKEHELSSIINSSQNVVFLKDRRGRYLLINQQYEKLFNITKQQIIGRTDFDVFPTETAEQFRQNDIKVLNSQKLVTTDETVPHPDGSIHLYRSDKFPLFDEDGKLYAVCGVSTDNTKLLKMNQQIQDSGRQVALLMNSTAEAVFSVDTHGDCTFVNQACIDILKFQHKEELLKKNMHQLTHYSHNNGDIYHEYHCPISKAYQEGYKIHIDDDVFWSSDGKTIPVEYWAYPIIEQDQITGAVITFLDTSRRKEIEEKLHIAKDEAEKANRSKSQVLANISHEIRTPLNAILGFSQILSEQAGKLPEQTRHYLNEINRSSLHLTELINNVLDLSRIEAGKYESIPETIHLKTLLKNVVDINSGNAETKKIHLHGDFSIDLPEYIYIDPTWLTTIIMNLLS